MRCKRPKPARVVHYAGALTIHHRNGVATRILAGWAACCWGRRAMRIRERGHNTRDAKAVTCKTCLACIAKAEPVA